SFCRRCCRQALPGGPHAHAAEAGRQAGGRAGHYFWRNAGLHSAGCGTGLHAGGSGHTRTARPEYSHCLRPPLRACYTGKHYFTAGRAQLAGSDEERGSPAVTRTIRCARGRSGSLGQAMKSRRHIHLIGICGTAMASLAGMLKQRGFKVTGSDAAAYPPMSHFLSGLGIPLAEPYAEANLQPHPDLVVVGNAISRGNVELEYLLDSRIPFCSLPQILHDEFLRGREVIVIAGTHGKTTTTSMLAWIFQSAGKRPAFLVGGIAENFGSSFALGDGGHFIIEGDEYDTAFFDKGPKFLHYFPDSVILTSVEFDHADIYKDLDAVKTAFKRLVNLVPRRGRIIAFAGNKNVSECVARALCPVERYGTSHAAWQIANLQLHAQHTHWSVLRDGRHWTDFDFPLAGEYNVLNATAAAAMAVAYGITEPQIAQALKTFKSVKRRLEVKAEVNGVTIIDDFAHHPTAIAETIKA